MAEHTHTGNKAAQRAGCRSDLRRKPMGEKARGLGGEIAAIQPNILNGSKRPRSSAASSVAPSQPCASVA